MCAVQLLVPAAASLLSVEKRVSVWHRLWHAVQQPGRFPAAAAALLDDSLASARSPGGASIGDGDGDGEPVESPAASARGRWSSPLQFIVPQSSCRGDGSLALVTASVRFGKRVAVFGDSVTLQLRITSRFPSFVTLSRVDVEFDVPLYNRSVYHADPDLDASMDVSALLTSKNAAVADLCLHPGRAVEVLLPLRLERSHTLQHHAGVTPDDTIGAVHV